MANNEHRYRSVLLNDNKGMITVGQINYYTSGTAPIQHRLCGVDNRIGTLDIAFWINKHVQTHQTFVNINSIIGNLQDGTRDPSSSDWINKKNLFKQNTTFIWGSLDKGGLFIYFRNSNKDIQLGGVAGYYTNNTLYRYDISRDSTWWSDYNVIRYILPCFLYDRGEDDTSMNGGSYRTYISIGYNRQISRDNYKILSYPLVPEGDIQDTMVYNAGGEVQSDNVMEVPWSNGWAAKSLLQINRRLCSIGVVADDVFDNSLVGIIWDNEHNEWSGYTHIEGWWYGEGVDHDENDGGGINPPQGGGGKWSTTNTPVKPTDVSGIEYDAFNSGFIHAYNPTAAELHQLASFLFSGITKNIANMLKKLMANPMDYIVGLNMCHFNVSCTSADSVKFGGVDTNVVMNVIDKQIVSMDGGSVTLEENAGGMLDYAPNTRVKIYIPYCGVHELPIDLVMGGTLKLQYIVDVLTGSLVAELSLIRDRSWLMGSEDAVTQGTGYDDGGLMWSYSGNCFIPIPIASTDYRNVVNGALGLVSGIGTSIATGNPLPLAGSVAGAVMNSKPQIQVGSNMGANYGYMTAQDAYLIIEQPVPAKPIEYQSWVGYPVNEMYTIDDYSGLMIVKNDTYWCGTVKNSFGVITPDEADELRELLNGGICV